MKEYDEVFREHVKKLTTPIFHKVLNETRKNRMSGRLSGSLFQKSVRIRPHNYRLFFDFSPSGFEPPMFEGVIEPTTGVGTSYKNIVSSIQYRLVNHKSTHEFTGYYGCRILVRKSKIEINPVEFTKDSHFIQVSTQEEVEANVFKVFEDIYAHVKSVLKCFLEDFGGVSQFKLCNATNETKVDCETGINRIERNLTFHGELVKKVYPGKENVEFKDPVSALNYLQNRAIENVSPEIAGAINNLATALQDPFIRLKEMINSYDDLLLYSEAISSLNERDRLELSEWIGKKFNGVLI